jgi:hypothetical protein
MAAVTFEPHLRHGREGSRWYNARPTGEELAQWFAQVPLHEGMAHEHFISGIVLIQAEEKSNEVVGYDNDGLPLIRERKDLVYVPYPKVEARVAYFWKLMEIRQWRGEILPVPPVGGDPIGLPPGYFRYSATKPDSKVVNFVGCSMQVKVWEPSRHHSEPTAVMTPPPGSKIVPTATRWDVDANALMKAETGAIGRALGVAGMLVVPGSGVATAEDMLELAGPPAGAQEPQLPEPETPVAPASEEQLREQAARLADELSTLNEKGHTEFQEWARGRNLRLDTAQGAALRGVVKKLEGLVEAARDS